MGMEPSQRLSPQARRCPPEGPCHKETLHRDSTAPLRQSQSPGPLIPTPQAHKTRWGEAPAESTSSLPASQRRAAQSPRRKSSAPPTSKKSGITSWARRNTSRIVSAGIRQAPKNEAGRIPRPVSVVRAGGSRSPAGARSVWRGRSGGSNPRWHRKAEQIVRDKHMCDWSPGHWTIGDGAQTRQRTARKKTEAAAFLLGAVRGRGLDAPTQRR